MQTNGTGWFSRAELVDGREQSKTEMQTNGTGWCSRAEFVDGREQSRTLTAKDGSDVAEPSWYK